MLTSILTTTAAASEESVGTFFVILALVFPLITGVIHASKGVSRNNGKLRCNACKSLIPATASVCPVCHRAAGHDVYSREGKKRSNNFKDMRFIIGIFWGIGIELALLAVIGTIINGF